MGKNAAKNWDRIYLKRTGNELLLSSCNEPENTWISSMKNTFEKVGMLDIFLNENRNLTTTTFSALFNREKDIFTQTALEAIKSMSKMKTYSFFKTELESGRFFSGLGTYRTEQLSPN